MIPVIPIYQSLFRIVVTMLLSLPKMKQAFAQRLKSFVSRLHLLKLCSGMLMFAVLGGAPPALAQSEIASPRQQLMELGRSLDGIARARATVDTTEALAELSAQAADIERAATALERELQPGIDQLDEQLSKLGAAVAGSEPPALALQRSNLKRERDARASIVAQLRVLAVRATHLSSEISEQRTELFSKALGKKVGSPLSPDIWRVVVA